MGTERLEFEEEVVKFESCLLCGPKDSRLLYRKKCPGLELSGEILRCQDCGFVYSKNRFTPCGMKAFYELKYQSGNYRHYADFQSMKIANFEKKIRAIKKVTGLQEGRLLDLGCGEGFALGAAHTLGFDVVGVEISESAVQLARKRGWKAIHQGDLADIKNLRLGQFDVITLFDVIDHLYDPREAILLLRDHLKPSGILYLDTSDIGSWYHTLLRGGYFNIQPFEHISYFSKKTIQNFLEMHGFRVLSITKEVRRFNLDFVEMTLSQFMPLLLS